MTNQPHSRACGITRHQHGADCHSTCPTCGGRPVEQAPTLPPTTTTVSWRMPGTAGQMRDLLAGHGVPDHAQIEVEHTPRDRPFDQDVTTITVTWGGGAR